jgi:hypothetical protein
MSDPKDTHVQNPGNQTDKDMPKKTTTAIDEPVKPTTVPVPHETEHKEPGKKSA